MKLKNPVHQGLRNSQVADNYKFSIDKFFDTQWPSSCKKFHVTAVTLAMHYVFSYHYDLYQILMHTILDEKKCLLVSSMHVVLWAAVPMAAAVNSPSCLVACLIHVLRSPGHVATQPPCAACHFIPVQTWFTKLLLQSWLIDRECWLFLPTTILQSHKKINSHEFAVILNRGGFTHFVSSFRMEILWLCS